jgi:hypothetical protein
MLYYSPDYRKQGATHPSAEMQLDFKWLKSKGNSMAG